MKKKCYMIYNKEDEIVCVGDSYACARFLGVSRQYFFEAISRKNQIKRRYTIYELKEDEDD